MTADPSGVPSETPQRDPLLKYAAGSLPREAGAPPTITDKLMDHAEYVVASLAAAVVGDETNGELADWFRPRFLADASQVIRALIVSHRELASRASVSPGGAPPPSQPDFDYPAAARSIALSLARFCDEGLSYPAMIADAARKAMIRIGELEAAAVSPVGEAGAPSADEWRCFHCDEVFTRREDAAQHFGESLADEAACRIKASEGSLVRAIRHLESEISQRRGVDDLVEHAFRCMQADQSEALRKEEEKGYARAVSDVLRLTCPSCTSAIRCEPTVAADDAERVRDADRDAAADSANDVPVAVAGQPDLDDGYRLLREVVIRSSARREQWRHPGTDEPWHVSLDETTLFTHRHADQLAALLREVQDLKERLADPAFLYSGSPIPRKAIEARNVEIDQLRDRARTAEREAAELRAKLAWLGNHQGRIEPQVDNGGWVDRERKTWHATLESGIDRAMRSSPPQEPTWSPRENEVVRLRARVKELERILACTNCEHLRHEHEPEGPCCGGRTPGMKPSEGVYCNCPEFVSEESSAAPQETGNG